ncbi:hypothetical protein LSTR_LSTR006468 [Laodelphax striatellus]|uniref:Enoyl reductase (ER) domain-containing protein n=1 Tax=Laodelphax striatellus TaxID=195883 RepID=A0A482WWU5_LAOST|nr:hypothetical protein LSTR_LSTR006468 [Laodelphax striatellus]
MDEIIFHLSQRLESLQVLAYSVIQQCRCIAETYADQSYQLALSAYNSPQLAHVHEITLEKLQNLVWILRDFSNTALRYSNPAIVYARISNVIGSDINRGNLYAGCVGFAVGGGFGIVLGLCLRPNSEPVTFVRAVAATSFSGIDSVSLLEDVIAPILSDPDDVLIEVKAASLDQIDIKIASGYARVLRRYLNKYNANVHGELPLVLGRDCAGIVIELGSAVTKLEVGDEVWAVVPPWSPGVMADTIAVKQSWVSRKPRCVSFEGAASIPYSGTVAWDAVVNHASLGPDTARRKKVLVHCGTSGVGVIITQLCRAWDAHVTVTCLNRASQTMSALGADEVVPLETANIERHLLKNRFDVVFNTAGSVAHKFCLDLCLPNGIVVTPVSSTLASDSYGMFFGTLYSAWIRITHCLFGYTSWGLIPYNTTVLSELSRLVDSGQIQPVVDRIFTPNDHERAFQHIDSARSIGKSIFKFSVQSRSLAQTRPDVVT